MNTDNTVYCQISGKSKLNKSLIALCISATFCGTYSANAEDIWTENFNAVELAGKGAINNTIDMEGITRWSIDVINGELTADSDWFKVNNGQMEARDVDGVVDWISEVIDVSGKDNINISLLASEEGTHEADDFFNLAYSIDGGPFVNVANWQGLGDDNHTLIDDFTSVVLSQAIDSASSLQLKVSMKNNAGTEYIRLDDIIITGNIVNGTGEGDSDTISGACFNCPDLTKIASATDFNDTSYYADVFTAITLAQGEEVIRSTINQAISQNHKQLTYSEVWTALTQTDEDPANPDNVILFYRGISKEKFSNGSGEQSSNQDNWNREHVWAKSHGFPSDTAKAYSDIHHLRPTDISVNSARGNLDFDFSDAPLAESPENRVDSDSFEPRDSVKGDVARIVFYMDVRYEGLDTITPDLQVVNTLTSGGEAKLGKLCALLSWSENDPVDDFELNRNNKIYEFQGNRNPFIDHPEWISLIYNQACSEIDPIPVDPDPVDPDPVEPDPVDPSADLFFSEYIEGSSFNKAVEIYNPTNNAITLTDYQFKLYSNGSAVPTGTYNLSGEILAHDVLVLGSSQITADSGLFAYIDLFTSAINFNGDDYIELVHGDTIIDSVGIYGVKESWGANQTLVRKSDVVTGDNNRNDDFVLADQWLVNVSDTFSFLGTHNANINPVEPGEDPFMGICGDESDKIHTIQGNSQISSFIDQTQIIEGVVTAIAENLQGYFVQEDPLDMDADSSTSEGIFVYHNGITNYPSVGNQVRVLGVVKESFGRTQLTASTDFVDCGLGETIQALPLSLPIASNELWENYEGMLVVFSEQLQVSDTYTLARFGQLTLSNGRLIIPTNIYNAGSPQAMELADKNSRNRIMLDDMNNSQNPELIPFPSPNLIYNNTLRLGDSITGLTGVVDYSFSEYRVLPTQNTPFIATNPRTPAPELNGNGSVKVASFNVLNYFNGTGDGEGFPTERGADTLEEFVRQSDKIVAALIDINADIVGLMEIENDGFDANSAIAELVGALNLKMGEGTYAYVSPNLAQVGSDAITVGLLYKPATMALVGEAVTTNQVPFDFSNRQPLVQTFKEISSNEQFTIAVNHFKSKGSCGSATGNNQDQQDGQGCWNELRTQAASSLVSWLNTKPTGTEDEDVLIIGDLNSYGKEDPINMITSNGYKNILAAYQGVSAYSYSFGGEIGYLDHALASTALVNQVVDTNAWHVNADEPAIFDYNTEFKSSSQQTNYYGDDAYRASDHDPVVILLNLNSTSQLIGDLDGDDDIDNNDIRQFSLMIRAGELFTSEYDFNGDGTVNSLDARALMSFCTRVRCATE